LISKIIEFKRGLNGRGSAKVGIEPSRIQDALPDSVNSTLQQLTAEFGKVVSDAEAIIAAQQNYSTTRRKRQPKKPKPSQPQAPTPQANEAQPAAPAPAEANPLARLGSFDADIEKIASNRLTRFWQYLTSVFSRKEYNRQRLGMLSLSADLYYNLLDFENDVLKISEKTIPSMINKFQNMRNTLIALKKLFENVAKQLTDSAKQEGVAPPIQRTKNRNVVPKSNEDDDLGSIHIDQIQHNVEKHRDKINPKDLNEITMMINAYENETDQHAKSIWLDQIKEEYKNIQQSIQSGNKTANVKIAHNAITRFLRKQLVKAMPSDKTAAPRLRAAELADSTKKIVKRLMNVLEKDLSVDEISLLLSQIDKSIYEISQTVAIINVLYKEKFSKENNESDKDLNVALRRKVRRDLFQGIL